MGRYIDSFTKRRKIEIEGYDFPSDDAFVKGAMMQAMKYDEFEYLYKHYELVTFAHPIYQQYQDIINKSLKLFKEDINNNNMPTLPIFISKEDDDYSVITRIRQMVRHTQPEGFDTLVLQKTEELDTSIKRRQKAAKLIKK